MAINVALHAQAYPEIGDKVVGSVVTTDGALEYNCLMGAI